MKTFTHKILALAPALAKLVLKPPFSLLNKLRKQRKDLVPIRGLLGAAVALAPLLVLSGCESFALASGDEYVKPSPKTAYDPLVQNHYSPRPVPATATHDDQVTLIKGGYFLLGEITVKIPANDPAQASDMILTEAAKRGADVVFITTSLKPYTEKLETLQEATPGGDTRISVIQRDYVNGGTKYAPLYKPPTPERDRYEKGFSASAAIWRHDPQRTDFTERDLQNLFSQAGKTHYQDYFAQYLLNQGIPVDYVVDKQGYTMLQNAAFKNDIEKAKFLLDHGANVNQPDQAQSTALMIAAQNSSTNMLNLLLSRGANVNLADRDGETAIFYAVSYCNSDEVTNHADVIRILLAFGADKNARDRWNRTPCDLIDKHLTKKLKNVIRAALGCN